MSETIGYIRVSTSDQTVENQKLELSKRYNITKWFEDDGISGTVKAKDRDGLSKLLNYIREGDTVVTYAIDRLGRNTIDVLETVEAMQNKGVAVITLREGFDLTNDYGKAMLTILSALAELERKNIKARQMAGIERAKKEGKALGRKKSVDDAQIRLWRDENNASIKQTAEHFKCSVSTVKRAMASPLLT